LLEAKYPHIALFVQLKGATYGHGKPPQTFKSNVCKGSNWHTIPGWGVVCAGERQTILALAGSGHTACKGGVCANAQIANSSMQMLGAWAFGLVYVRVGNI
jgi:hypothetical protein